MSTFSTVRFSTVRIAFVNGDCIEIDSVENYDWEEGAFVVLTQQEERLYFNSNDVKYAGPVEALDKIKYKKS